MKKKLLSLFLALTLALSLAAPAWAATPEEAQDSAQLLYNLGLFQGSGTNEDGSPRFALERAPTRAEAVTILARLLGAEEAAQAQTWTTPFTDVPDWAQSYVGYAYAKGYTTGVEPTRFGSSTPVSTAQFLTLLLRALGYEDGKDFTWSTPWTLTDQLGITDAAAFKKAVERYNELARAGETTRLRKSLITIYEMNIEEFDLPRMRIRVRCSKGTYIRSLAREIGEALQSGAHLTSLRRTRSGGFTLENAWDLEEFLKKLQNIETK